MLIDDVDMMVTTIIHISVALTMRLCVDFCGGESYSVGLCWVLLLLDFLPLCVVSCGHCASREMVKWQVLANREYFIDDVSR